MLKISLTLFVLTSLSACVSLFDVERKEIASIAVPGAYIKIFYIAGNATMQDCIQVVNVTSEGNAIVLENYERYDVLEDYKLVNDTCIQLILRDSTSYLGTSDTFLLALRQPAESKFSDNLTLQRDVKGNVVRTTLVDSLKWVLYAFSYEGKAMSLKTRDTIASLACSLKLAKVKTRGKDTIVYYFDVFYGDEAQRCAFWPMDNQGVGTIKGEISYLLASHFVSDPIPDRIFLSHEASFARYLKSYKGEINEWLKEEAVKRDVLE